MRWEVSLIAGGRHGNGRSPHGLADADVLCCRLWRLDGVWSRNSHPIIRFLMTKYDLSPSLPLEGSGRWKTRVLG